MKRVKFFTATISCVLLANMVSGCGWFNPASITRTLVSETLVTQIDAPLVSYLASSLDGRRVAYITEMGGKQYVVVDGVPDKKGYDAIGSIGATQIIPATFSQDSKRVAYIGIDKLPTGNSFYVVINGEEGDAYSSAGSVTFSPNSKHVAYNVILLGYWGGPLRPIQYFII